MFLKDCHFGIRVDSHNHLNILTVSISDDIEVGRVRSQDESTHRGRFCLSQNLLAYDLNSDRTIHKTSAIAQ